MPGSLEETALTSAKVSTGFIELAVKLLAAGAVLLSALPLEVQAAKLDVAQMEVDFDSLVPTQLLHDDIAGAAIVVVNNGRVAFAKGYGLADTVSLIPVSADKTLFRLGSVSKLFTWEAVMQQVEQGRIELDRDIDDYLDFRVRGLDDTPITMRELMTHTAGFEDRFQGLWTTNSSDVTRLRDYLVNDMPARIYAPGTVPAYSNYGAVLAGYIVQRVAGEPFAQYLQRHVIDPLSMRSTSALQPLPNALAPLMARGYVRADGTARPFEFMRSPAGGVSASANDMGRFMLAQLNGGMLDGERILSSTTTAEMLTPGVRWPDNGNALGLGWLDLVEDGPHRLGHDGATLYFQSILNLYPESNAGLFVALNSRGANPGATLTRIVQAFDRHLPVPPSAAEAIVHATCPAGMEGSYMPTRRSETGMSYVAAFAAQWHVSCSGGTLHVSGAGMHDLIWRPVAPLVWRADDGSHMHLRLAEDGSWEASDGNPVNHYQQARWFQDARLLALQAAFGLFAVTLWAVRGLLFSRRSYRLAAVPRQGVLPAAVLVLLVAAGGLVVTAVVRTDWILHAWFDVTLQVFQLAGWICVIGLAVWLSPGHRRGTWAWMGWLGAAALATLAWRLNFLAIAPRY